MLAEKYGFRDPRKITLIGVGPGTGKCLTAEAREAIESADVLIGAERMLKVAEDVGVERHEEYRAEKIHEFIQMNSRYRRVAILLSGDTGFYSGAASLKEELKEYDVTVLPGISSVSCMAARIGVGLEGVPLLSIHGRSCNYLDYLREYGRIFLLVSSGKEIRSVLTRLCKYGWKQARVYVGSRLSYPKERIVQGLAERLAKAETEWDGLSVIYIELPRHRRPEPSDAKDEEFIRGKVPMTKSEVRSVILSRMAPAKDAVIYDVGAGTGSVSIQLAKKAIDGTVYAVEKNPEAIALIRANQRKFLPEDSDFHVVEGAAPECLEGLPAPSCAFIGGSGGNLTEIIESLLRKNPNVRIVISAITLETLALAVEASRRWQFEESQIIQAGISQAEKIGRYHMQKAQNPIYLITLANHPEGGAL